MTQDKKAPARKVSREMQVAETRLRRFADRYARVEECRVQNNMVIDSDRAEYIRSLPFDVRRGLVACGVIEADEAHEPSFHGDGRVD